MDEHSVPTLAMDWILSRTSSGELFATFAQTKLHPAHAPLFVNPFAALPAYVLPSFVAPCVVMVQVGYIYT